MTEESEIDWKARFDSSEKRRRRAEKKAARANEANTRLRRQLRDLDWEYRKLHIAVEGDTYHVRKLQLANERIALIKDIINYPLDDDVNTVHLNDPRYQDTRPS